MRLIDGDELIEHVWRDRLDSRERIANLVESMPTIKAIPAADVAPVIRCKDCEHDISSQFDMEARCNLWGCLKPKRGFCDAGKRREE